MKIIKSGCGSKQEDQKHKITLITNRFEDDDLVYYHVYADNKKEYESLLFEDGLKNENLDLEKVVVRGKAPKYVEHSMTPEFAIDSLIVLEK